MKLKLLVSLIFLTGIILSCSKVSKEDREAVEGTYEWFYSFNGYTQSNYYESIDDKYAIKIWKSGKVIFFKNSVEVKKGKMESVIDNQNEIHVMVRWDKWDTDEFEITNEQITFLDWPFEEHTNYFIRP